MRETFGIKLPKTKKTKIAVFDMDETLIHSVDDIFKDPFHHIIPLRGEEKSHKEKKTNANSIGFNIRPHALECLKAVAKSF